MLLAVLPTVGRPVYVIIQQTFTCSFRSVSHDREALEYVEKCTKSSALLHFHIDRREGMEARTGRDRRWWLT